MNDARCPCSSGLVYADCCGPLHAGTSPAATATALMRSRFSAFALADTAYLVRTWHPSTRPRDLVLDDDLRWYRLDVIASSGGGLLDTTGTVEFVAYARGSAGAHRLHEVSRFVRDSTGWTYVDGVVRP